MTPIDKKLMVVCECNSLDHIFRFETFNWPQEPIPELFLEVNLVRRSFLERLVYGIKYVLGYKSRYGAVDSTIISPKDAESIRDFMIEFLRVREENVKAIDAETAK